MRRTLRMFAFVCLVTLLIGSTAHADDATPDAVPTDFNEIFSMIEALVLGDKINLNPIEIGSCVPTIGFGIPSINLFFPRSSLCPIAGNVTLGLLPTRASISLDVYSGVLERISMDVLFDLKIALGSTTTNMSFSNAYMLIRLAPGQPVQQWTITGKGARQQGGGKIEGKMRINFFENTSHEGYAMLKTVTQVSKKAGKVKNIQLCKLTGADPADYLVGQLDECKVLVDQK